MSITNHVFRRGAVYTWRRRIPAGVRQEGRSAVLQLSLQTCGRREAQRLAAIVTVESDAVFWAMEHQGLTPAAAKALLERTIRAAQAQFARAELAAMDDARPGAWEEDKRFDLAAGHAFRLLALRGRSATLTDEDRTSLARQGMEAKDLVRLEQLLSVYKQDFWSEGRMNRLRREVVETEGVLAPTLLDLQFARQVELKGRAAVLIHRGRGHSAEDLQAEIDLAGRLAAEIAGELTAVLSVSEASARTNTDTPAPANALEALSVPVPATSLVRGPMGKSNDPIIAEAAPPRPPRSHCAVRERGLPPRGALLAAHPRRGGAAREGQEPRRGRAQVPEADRYGRGHGR